MPIPELLAPAGNLEKLKLALLYGADAVYVSGQKYGLRASADNFTDFELKEGISFAHERGRKVYVTLNAFFHDEDFDSFVDYCHFLGGIGVDAVIVSDLGVLRVVKGSTHLSVHLSTQVSCLNSEAAILWKSLGVNRIVLGRELSIQEAGEISRQSGVDVELFIHGAMCMSHSGHCVISNFTAGRDANRGGCVQSCRFGYETVDADASTKAQLGHFLSSKDLMGLELLDSFVEHGIHSLKIEGRMKSQFYIATTVSAYRQGLDAIKNGSWSKELQVRLEMDLLSIPHRDYCSGSLVQLGALESVYNTNTSTPLNASHEMVALVLSADSERVVIRTFAPIQVGATLEFLAFSGKPICHKITELKNGVGRNVSYIRQETIAGLPAIQGVAALNVVRMESVITSTN